MKPVAPRTGAPEMAFAADGSAIPFSIAVYDYGIATGLLTRWRLTPEERAMIAAGQDIYVMQLNYGEPMAPLKVTVGASEF